MTKLAHAGDRMVIDELNVHNFVPNGISRTHDQNGGNLRGLFQGDTVPYHHNGYSIEGENSVVTMNYQGALAEIMAKTSIKQPSVLMNSIDVTSGALNSYNMKLGKMVAHSGPGHGGSHRRSVSDGNTIFHSQLNNPPQGQQPPTHLRASSRGVYQQAAQIANLNIETG